MLIGELAEGLQVGAGKQRIGGDFAEYGTDRLVLEQFGESSEVALITERQKVVRIRSEALLNFEGIDVGEAELHGGPYGVQSADSAVDGGDGGHTAGKEPDVLG